MILKNKRHIIFFLEKKGSNTKLTPQNYFRKNERKERKQVKTKSKNNIQDHI